MKILSIIPAILICFLSLHPVLINQHFIEQNSKQALQNCCNKNKHGQSGNNNKQQPQNNNCCNKGECNNPFLSCSHCCFVHPDKFIFSVAGFTKNTEKIRLANEDGLSSYTQDFWHPPEFI